MCAAPRLERHRYGKRRVRLTHLDRGVSPHRFAVCTVDVALEGDFAASYTAGDNRSVVATDSMKNTVYVLAREHGVDSIERFASLLAGHFVDSYAAVDAALIEVQQERWQPIEAGGEVAASAFWRGGSELALASARCSADGLELRCGLDRLQVAKTSDSGFSDFHRDRFTTLADTEDRIFATTVSAELRGTALAASSAADDLARRDALRAALLGTFAAHRSRSVQETLHAMGTAVLDRLAEVEAVTLRLPNQHHPLVDLTPFGLDNPNCVFVGTDEPFGDIEATLVR